MERRELISRLGAVALASLLPVQAGGRPVYGLNGIPLHGSNQRESAFYDPLWRQVRVLVNGQVRKDLGIKEYNVPEGWIVAMLLDQRDLDAGVTSANWGPKRRVYGVITTEWM